MKISWTNTFTLSDAPDSDLLIAKEHAGFTFDSATALWCGNADSVDKLRSNSLRLKSELTITEQALTQYKAAGKIVLDAVEASRAEDSDMFIPVPDGLELLPFQRAGVAYAAKRPRVLIADEMGLGKTIQAIATVNASKAHQVLVICPASLKINWAREFKKWNTKFLDTDIISGTEPVQFCKDVTIINYDILQAHREALREMNWDVIILDECHYLKNKKADRTREVFGGIKRNAKKEIIDRVEPLKTKNVIMMTGTPLNKPKELWSMIQILDPDGLGADWFKYAKRYCGLFEITKFNSQTQKKDRIGWKWDGAENSR